MHTDNLSVDEKTNALLSVEKGKKVCN